MIDEIQFENYRAFGGRQTLSLKPITVVFGKNNSGKTAVLKMPVLIEASLKNNKNELFPFETEQGVEICSEARDVVYGRANRAVRFVVSSSESDATLDYSFFVDATKEKQVALENFRLGNKDAVAYSFCDSSSGKTYSSLNDVACDFDDDAKDLLDKLNFKTDYISSIREKPSLDTRLDSVLPDYSKSDGSGCYQYLIREALKTNSDSLDKISGWYERNFDNWKLVVDKKQAPVYHIEMQNGVFSLSILNSGFGIIQSLPVVVCAIRKRSEPTLIILEEPETHLHPAAHANLAELIATSTIDDKNKKYLIETHSQNFLLRLRRMIAEKKISKGDVALYYVSFDASTMSSCLKQIIINDDGLIDSSTPWPEGIFEESLQEVIGIRDALQ